MHPVNSHGERRTRAGKTRTGIVNNLQITPRQHLPNHLPWTMFSAQPDGRFLGLFLVQYYTIVIGMILIFIEHLVCAGPKITG